MLDAVSIIGGADGPTSVFVSGNPGTAALIGAFVVLMIAAMIFIIGKRKKK